MGDECKAVPRWVVNEEGLNKIIQYQRMNKKPEQIFGRLKPKHVKQQFDLRLVFSKGDDARSYMDFDARGESADWND